MSMREIIILAVGLLVGGGATVALLAYVARTEPTLPTQASAEGAVRLMARRYPTA